MKIQIVEIERKLAFSTTTPLGANAVYTSPTIDANNYKLFTMNGKSDVAGNYQLDYSDDGITWVGGTNVPTGANTFFNNQLVNFRRYVRFIYTNGAASQTSFNLTGTLFPL